MAYQIVQLSGIESSQLEQLGTKRKFWYTNSAKELILFKIGRPNTGENWAEKACSEICSLLGLPHATYELANWDGIDGVITPSFTSPGSRLVHGNELLAKSSPGEEGQMNYAARQHTVRHVVMLLGIDRIKLPLNHTLPPAIKTVPEVFVGYLMLDALVGNQDRHFENWGLIFETGVGTFLAPTYDHASSLGRNETDQRRADMMSTRDQGQSIEAYVSRAKSMMYPSSGTTERRLLTIDAFFEAAALAPSGAKHWVETLESLTEESFNEILEKIPDEVITQTARDFAKEMLVQNRQRILSRFNAMVVEL